MSYFYCWEYTGQKQTNKKVKEVWVSTSTVTFVTKIGQFSSSTQANKTFHIKIARVD